jgi:hypothetical protein
VLTGLGNLGCVQLKKIQAKLCIIIILANTKNIQANVAANAINLGCGQLE